MPNIICDKAGYALSLSDRVKVEPMIIDKSIAAQPFVGEVTGFNPGMVYCIRVSQPGGIFGWYRRSEVRKLAARTLRIAEINPVPFRRA